MTVCEPIEFNDLLTTKIVLSACMFSDVGKYSNFTAGMGELVACN